MDLTGKLEMGADSDSEEQRFLGPTGHEGISSGIVDEQIDVGAARGSCSDPIDSLPTHALLEKEQFLHPDGTQANADHPGACSAKEHPVHLGTGDDAASGSSSVGWSSDDDVLEHPLDLVASDSVASRADSPGWSFDNSVHEHPVHISSSEDASSRTDSTGWSSDDEAFLHFPPLRLVDLPYFDAEIPQANPFLSVGCSHSLSLREGSGSEAAAADGIDSTTPKVTRPVFAKLGWSATFDGSSSNSDAPMRRGIQATSSKTNDRNGFRGSGQGGGHRGQEEGWNALEFLQFGGDGKTWLLCSAAVLLGTAAAGLMMKKQNARDGIMKPDHCEIEGLDEAIATAKHSGKQTDAQATAGSSSAGDAGSQSTETGDHGSAACSSASNARSLPDCENAADVHLTRAPPDGLEWSDQLSSLAEGSTRKRDLSLVSDAMARQHSSSIAVGDRQRDHLSSGGPPVDRGCEMDTHSSDFVREPEWTTSHTQSVASITSTPSTDAGLARVPSRMEVALQERLMALREELEQSEQRRHKALSDLAKLSTFCGGDAGELKERLKDEQQQNAEMSNVLKHASDQRDGLVLFLEDSRKTLAALEPGLVQASSNMDSLTDTLALQHQQLQVAQKELQEVSNDRDAMAVRVQELQHDTGCAERLLEALDPLQLANGRDGALSLDDVAVRLELCAQGLRQDQLGGTNGRCPMGSLLPRMQAALEALICCIKQALESSNPEDCSSTGLVEKLRTVAKEKRQLESELASTRGDLGHMLQERSELERTATELETAVHREMAKLTASQDHQYRLKKALDEAHRQRGEVQQLLEAREHELVQVRGSVGSAFEEGKKAQKQAHPRHLHSEGGAMGGSHMVRGSSGDIGSEDWSQLQVVQEHQESEVQVLRADLEVAQSRYRALQDKCRRLEKAQSMANGRPGESPLPNGSFLVHEWGTGADSMLGSECHTPGFGGYSTPLSVNPSGSCYSADPFAQQAARAWPTIPNPPQAGPIAPPTSQAPSMGQRRGSWPQDLSTALTDQVMMAAQEVMELTANSVQMANRHEMVTSELMEARRTASTTQQQLQERDATVNDLTEQFLQVYQIANDLASDNEQARREVKDLRNAAEALKSQLADKERKIAAVEQSDCAAMLGAPPDGIDHLSFLSARSAPPRSTSPGAVDRLAARAVALANLHKRGASAGDLSLIPKPVAPVRAGAMGTKSTSIGSLMNRAASVPEDDVLLDQVSNGLPVWQKGDATLQSTGRRGASSAGVTDGPRASTGWIHTISSGLSSHSYSASSRSPAMSSHPLESGDPLGQRQTQSLDMGHAPTALAARLQALSGNAPTQAAATQRSSASDASPASSAAATAPSLSGYVGGLPSTGQAMAGGMSARSAFDGSDLSLSPKQDDASGRSPQAAFSGKSLTPTCRQDDGDRRLAQGHGRSATSTTPGQDNSGRSSSNSQARGLRAGRPARRVAAKAARPWV